MKNIFMTILLIALFATCIALVACNGQTVTPEYFGTYTAIGSLSGTLKIDNTGFKFDDTYYTYEVNNEYFYLKDFKNSQLRKFYKYENGNVLSPNLFLNFTTGQITRRDGNINASLISYSGTSVDLSWQFELNGTYRILAPSNLALNESGTYILKNGLLTLVGIYALSGKKAYHQYYIDPSFRIHAFAYVKDMSIFERGQSNNTPSGGGNAPIGGNNNPEHSHKYTSKVIAPNCTERGYTLYTCSCGDSYKDDYTDAITGFHCYEPIGTASIDTSCALSSTQQYKCSVCGDEITRFANIADGVSDCHNHLEVDETCEHCGYKVYFKNSDGMVLMDIGNNNLSAEFYGETAKQISESLKPYVTNVFFSSAVKTIEYGNFFNCDNLEYVTIPQSVISLGSDAFSYCDKLNLVNMPQHLYSFIRSFEDTPWFYNLAVETVDGIEYRGNVAMRVANNGGLPPTTVKLKDGTIGIAYSAFDDCDYLSNITIPDSVTSIGDYAFSMAATV